MQKYMYVCQFIRWLFVTLKGKLWWLGQWWRRAGSLLPQGTQQVWQFMWWSHEYYGLCTWCYAGSKQNLSLFLFLSLYHSLSLTTMYLFMLQLLNMKDEMLKHALPPTLLIKLATVTGKVFRRWENPIKSSRYLLSIHLFII